MSSATDNLLKAAKAVLDDHEVQSAIMRSSETQYKLRDLNRAVQKAESENRQGPPERP